MDRPQFDPVGQAPKRDEAAEACIAVLAKWLIQAKAGQVRFLALVVVSPDGTPSLDFMGATNLIPLGNLALDELKGGLRNYFGKASATQSSIMPATPADIRKLNG